MSNLLINKGLGHFGGRQVGLVPGLANKANRPFLDAAESTFFLRQLEHIKTQVIDIEYAKLKASLLLPVSTEVRPGAEYWTWRQFDKTGRAKVIRDYAKDLPRVDVLGAEFINNPIVSLGDSFGYNMNEIRNAQYTGFPLDQRRAMTAVEAILRLEDDLAFFGSAEDGLFGFLNNSVMGEAVLPAVGAGGLTQWATKTADQILDDLNLLPRTIVTTSKEVEIPDTILLPTNAYQIASTKRIGRDSNMTVLKYFLETNPYIKDVESLPKLAGIGALGSDRMICYERNPMKLEMIRPMAPTQYEPEKENLEYKVALESRFGGVVIYKPKSVIFADGL
jgi:hypothetical protein